MENIARVEWFKLVSRLLTDISLLLVCCFSSLFFYAVLLKFRTDKGRDPDPQAFPEDSQLLRQIRDDVLDALHLSSDLLNDDFIRSL